MHKIDVYDDYANEYVAMVAGQEQAGVDNDPFVPHLLDVLGDVSCRKVLDAGCGSGYLSRILAMRGANVTGIDISTRLIGFARAQEVESVIAYQVADLSQPLPDYDQHFDLVVSHFVLNDVYDYHGFIRTIGTVVKHGGRVVIGMNNPYSYVVRNHVHNYFDSGTAYSYRGMAAHGIDVHFYQRTLGEYLDAFFVAGLRLERLVDAPMTEQLLNKPTDKLLPQGYRFPYYMILSFVRP